MRVTEDTFIAYQLRGRSSVRCRGANGGGGLKQTQPLPALPLCLVSEVERSQSAMTAQCRKCFEGWKSLHTAALRLEGREPAVSREGWRK